MLIQQFPTVSPVAHVTLIRFGLLAALAGGGWAQSFEVNNLNPFSSGPGGIKLYGAYISSGYYTGYVPGLGATGSLPLEGGSAALSGGATFGWARTKTLNSISVSYSPSFSMQVRRTDLRAVNHSFSFAWNRKLARRLRFSFSAGASVSNALQSLLSPGAYGQLAGVPATFEELASAVLEGRYSNGAFAAILTGYPFLDSPTRTLLYGNRVLSVPVSASLAYSATPRLNISLSAGASRIQHLGDVEGEPRLVYLIPQTTSGSASVAVSYSLSPRTQIGFSASASRSLSRFQDAYYVSGAMTASRIFGRRWFASASGGSGTVYGLRQIYDRPTGLQYTASGSIGFRTASHTLLASVGRSFGDSQFALGGTATVSVNGAWSWKVARGWTVSASGGEQYIQSGLLPNTTGWHASGSIGHALNRHTTISASYSYSTSTQPALLGYELTQSGIQAGLSWSPLGGR
jgi:hypothetical protein